MMRQDQILELAVRLNAALGGYTGTPRPDRAREIRTKQLEQLEQLELCAKHLKADLARDFFD